MIITVAVIITVLAVAVAALVSALLRKSEQAVVGARCQVVSGAGTINLDIEQAQIAATIAAVAADRKLPERAVVIAYATGIQESKLRNLPFGDRDSVGVFQQRPSQGWGPAEKLQDPVYATNKFFASLAKIRAYEEMPLHKSAQLVQRSADGSLYAQHEQDAKLLAGAFTGRIAHAVACSYPITEEPRRIADARKELTRALGSDGSTVGTARAGWLAATWAVANAQKYGLNSVSHSGFTWVAKDGEQGWQKDTKASAGRVDLR